MYISPISTLNFLGEVKEYALPGVTERNSHNLSGYRELTKFTDTDLSISPNNEKTNNFYMPSKARYNVSIKKKLEDGTTLLYSHSVNVEKSLTGDKLESEIYPLVYNGYSLFLQDIVNHNTGFPLRYSSIVKK